MGFTAFANAIRTQFESMATTGLYAVAADKNVVWDTYLDSFPEGTNLIYQERREYDCQCCKQFIRNVGHLVTIVDGKLVSIWDVEAEGYYADVAKAMSAYVKQFPIINVYMTSEPRYGGKTTHQMLENGEVKVWSHFNCTIPSNLVSSDYPTKLSKVASAYQVFNRGLEELTVSALTTVSDLIAQNSLHRGAEFAGKVDGFLALKVAYDEQPTAVAKNIFVWKNIKNPVALTRNSAIGTLLQDLSADKDLVSSVKSYEDKVSGTNFKRSSALITPGMIKKATDRITELGIEPALSRRFARIDDISVNNVLFVDRSVSPLMKDSIADLLATEVRPNNKVFDKVEEIGINEFISDVLPHAESLEVLVKNAHKSNLVSLIAPQDEDAKSIFKWNNPFSWSYNGNITDSMKENVKAAGGRVTGDLRFSIQWNDQNDNPNDLDAHCKQPSGLEICYSNANGRMSGTLDVDITQPRGVAVENIIFTDKRRMKEGIYEFQVRNFSERGGKNFTAEIEFEEQIFSFSYTKKMRTKERVTVAKVQYSKAKGFKLIESLPHEALPSTNWNISTENFQKVSSVMYSPNFWDGQTQGNQHFFFMLDGCKNPERARGFYNEFLDSRLNEDRKVFEVLADKMKCELSDDQLSGLGFSITQRNELICKVNGSFTRTLKIKF